MADGDGYELRVASIAGDVSPGMRVALRKRDVLPAYLGSQVNWLHCSRQMFCRGCRRTSIAESATCSVSCWSARMTVLRSGVRRALCWTFLRASSRFLPIPAVRPHGTKTLLVSVAFRGMPCSLLLTGAHSQPQCMGAWGAANGASLSVSRWKVLAPQLTSGTVGRLILLAGPLHCSPDAFYEHIVRRVGRALANEERRGEASSASGAGNDIGRDRSDVALASFGAVAEVLESMHSPAVAVGACEWVAQQMPPGALKVLCAATVRSSFMAAARRILVILCVCRALVQAVIYGRKCATETGAQGSPRAAAAAEAGSASHVARLLAAHAHAYTEMRVHALGSAGVKLMSLVPTPAELISAIFEQLGVDAEVERRRSRDGLSTSDGGTSNGTGYEAHAAAIAIAVVNGINLNEKKIVLVKNWIYKLNERGDGTVKGAGSASDDLLSLADGAGTDESVLVPCAEERDNAVERDCEARLVYLLSPPPDATAIAAEAGAAAACKGASGSSPRRPLPPAPPAYGPHDAAKALLPIAFAFKAVTKPMSHARARALAICFRVAPWQALEAVCKERKLCLPYGDRRPVTLRADLEQLWRYCCILARCERLHIPLDIEALHACSKAALVRGLWRDHRGDAGVLSVITDVMLDYGVQDMPLWVAVLRQLQSCGRWRRVMAVLGHLASLGCGSARGDYDAQLGGIFERTISRVLEEVKADADGGLSVAAQCALEEAVCLCERCPVLHAIDVPRIAGALLRIGAAAAPLTLRAVALVRSVQARAALLRTMLSDRRCPDAVYVATLAQLTGGAGDAGLRDQLAVVASGGDAAVADVVFDELTRQARYHVLLVSSRAGCGARSRVALTLMIACVV